MQKAVWGRAFVYQMLDLHQLTVEAAGYGLLWNEVRGRLQALTARQVEFDPAGPVSGFLTTLAEDLRSSMMPFPDGGAEKVCSPMLDDIERLLADAGRLRNDPLQTLFTDTLRAAAGAYRACGLPLPDDMVTAVEVSFDHQSAPVDSALPIQVIATTRLGDTPSGVSAHVDIVVSPTYLDELTVFALPYVLLHECVCHVFQGPWGPGRIQADADSRFAEGWMDHIAYTVACDQARALAGGKPASSLSAVPRPGALREAADQVHRARHQPHPRDRAWAARAMGVRAARNLAELMTRLPELAGRPVEAAAAFRRLSLRLNVSEFSNTQRDLFVAAVHKATLARTEHGLVVQLRRYLERDDLVHLVEGTVKLFT
ncbi:hypothetical protein [Actinoplanes sp. NPDC026670]|uniref:hypothetical protein n=1 Tax=Actinoplanes sp. NPDC026670 TaxID=3154700 RepID=UPI0033EF8D80